MIVLPQEMGGLMPGIIGITFALCVWVFAKREHRKLRARYFAKYGRYPGDPKPSPAPAE